MIWLIIGCVIIAIIGIGTLIGGAPFVPTRRKWIADAMRLAKVGPGDVVVDLGSGNGAVLAAALQRGARSVVGYEINPLLAAWSRLKLRRFKGCVTIKTANFFRTELPVDTTVIYLFQVKKVAEKIPNLIEQQRSNLGPEKIRLICFGAEIPGRKFVRECRGMSLYEF